MDVPGTDRTPLQRLDEWLERWRVRLLWLFTALVVLGIVLGQAAQRFDGVDDPQTLQRARDAAAMVDELRTQNHGWPPAEQAVAPGDDSLASPAGLPIVESAASAASAASASTRSAAQASVPAVPAQASAPSVQLLPIRWALAFDSLLVVPGYLGWFFLATGFLYLRWMRAAPPRRPAGRIDWREFLLQVLCVLPAAAAAFDWAENGITMLAIEDAVAGVLADATVHDMNLATWWKWTLIAFSAALVAMLAVVAVARSGRRDTVLLASAVLGALAFVTLWPLAEPLSAARALLGMLLLASQMGCVGRRIVHPEIDSSQDHGSDDPDVELAM